MIRTLYRPCWVLQDDCKVVRLPSYRLEKVGLQTLEPWIPAKSGNDGLGAYSTAWEDFAIVL